MNTVLMKWAKEVRDIIAEANEKKEYSWVSLNHEEANRVLNKLECMIDLMEEVEATENIEYRLMLGDYEDDDDE